MPEKIARVQGRNLRALNYYELICQSPQRLWKNVNTLHGQMQAEKNRQKPSISWIYFSANEQSKGVQA